MKKTLLILSLALIIFLPELHAKKTKWNGSGGTTDWNTAGNWSSGVPDFGDDAEIPAGQAIYPIIVTGVIANVKKLTIKGTLTMNGGELYHDKEFKVEQGGFFFISGGVVYGADDPGIEPERNFKNNGTTIQTGGTINCKDFKIEKATAVFNQSGSASLITIGHDYKTKKGGTFNSTGGTVKWTGVKKGGNGVTFNDGTNQFFNIQFEGPEHPNIQKKGGTILARGSWTNNNPNLDLASDKDVFVIFNGSSAQTIGGTASTTFDYLEINTSGGAIVTLTGDQVVNTDLTITAGTLEINSISTLSVNGIATNNVGDAGLVLKSDALGTASMIHNTTGVAATVERFLTDAKWHFIGIPVSNAIAGVFNLPPGLSDIYLRAHIESTNSWGPYIVPDATPLYLGQGYEVWVGDPAGFSQDETVQFFGSLNAGDYTTGSGGFYDLDYTPGHGLNLISNPYPSALHANIHTWTKSNVANSVWTWSDDFGNYVYWNGIDGTGGGIGVGTLTDGIIPSMQAFFVLANGPSPSITIPQIDQIHSDQAYYKESTIISNTLKLEVEGNNYKDIAFVAFNEQASDDFENYDVIKMFGLNEAPQLYSIHSKEFLSINTLSTIQNTTFVDLGFECSTAEVFTIKASELESFDEGGSIYLEDKTDGTLQNLAENSSYTFAHDPLNDADRFVLHFGAPNEINEQLEEKEDVKIFSYANQVYIVPEIEISGDIFIYDILGKQVKSESLQQGVKTVINVNQKMGYYIVKVVTENSVVTKKVFIK